MDDEPVPLPITNELDLHAFRPNEVGSLLEEYFRECRRLGIREVRVIHGKGTGALREVVAELLVADPRVRSFRPGGFGEGGNGVTVAEIG